MRGRRHRFRHRGASDVQRAPLIHKAFLHHSHFVRKKRNFSIANKISVQGGMHLSFGAICFGTSTHLTLHAKRIYK